MKDVDETKNFGGSWHSDTTYLERPPLGTMLYAKEVPPAGGDTLFANTYLAYESLSDGMKRLIDGLVGVSSGALTARGGRAADLKLKAMTAINLDQSEMAAEHPVVRTPGDRAQGALPERRAYRPLRRLDRGGKPSADRLSRPARGAAEFTCRLRWEVGTLTLWDNRCTQHCAINDYHGHRPVMHRVTIEGDRPS